jgi:N-acyl-D-aspartate/D-glutamate deacylase
VAHTLSDGSLVPGSQGDRDELLALAEGVRRAGGGMVQFLGDFPNWEVDLAFMTEMSRRANAPVHFTMTDQDGTLKLAAIEAAEAEGARLVGHLAPRAIGNIVQWRATRHPFMHRPSIKAIAHLPWPDQLERLKDPAFRAQVLSEGNGAGEEGRPDYAQVVLRGFDKMYEMGALPDYEPESGVESIAARAAAIGQEPQAYAYDVMMRNEGTGMMYMTIANYRAGDFSELRPLMEHPGTVVSLSDAGAHCTRIVDASLTTFMLTHWARDRDRGETMPLAQVVKQCSRDNAVAYGLSDRGVVAPGYLADLNVIDLARLELPAPYMSFDFPAGGRRLLQKANGYAATIKRGQVTFREGEHSGAFPGTLIRGSSVEAAVL